MRRAAVPVLVSLLIVFAGCIGGSTTDDPGTTTEPTTAEPTTNEPTTDGQTTEDSGTTTDGTPDGSEWSNGPFPAGVSETGVTNLSALLSAHSQGLLEQGFELQSEYRVTGSGSDRFTDYTLDRRTRAAAGLDGTRSTVVRMMDGDRMEAEQWLNESLMLTRSDGDGDVQYRGQQIPPSAQPGPALVDQFADVYRLEPLLRSTEFEVVEVTRNGEGVRAHLESTAFGSEVRNDGEYADGQVSLVVDGAGVIRSVSASGTQRDGGTFAFEYRIDRLGVESVERPGWLADAPPVVQPDLEFEFENCTTPYLVLAHQGGDALPAGSTLTIEAQNATHEIVLDSELDGETRYVYLDVDGALRVSSDPPAADERSSIGNEVSVNVVTDEGYHVLSAGMGFGCESASEGGSSSGGSSGSGSASGGSSEGGSASGGSSGSESGSTTASAER